MLSVDTSVTLKYSLFYMIMNLKRRLIVWSFITEKKLRFWASIQKLAQILDSSPFYKKTEQNIELTIRITQQMMQLGVP